MSKVISTGGIQETMIKTKGTEWQSLAVAAKNFKISRYVLNTLIAKHHIRVKSNPYDSRFRLVDVDALRKILTAE